MPSCVVRWCKNFTKKCNKSQGISYHTFPRNQDQKDNWVRIIRDCRDENDWNPSSSSTVCSVHFDNDDFVTTAKGLRRLVQDAIPKKFLSNSPETQTNCTSSSMRQGQISPNVKSEANDPQPASSSGMISCPLQVSPPRVKFESAGYCRLCAATYCHSKLFNIHSDDVLKKLVVNMTKRLNTNVDFSQEYLPTTICFDCVTKLYTAYDFVVGIDLAQLTLNEKPVQNDQNRMPENIIFSKNMIPSKYLQQILPDCDAAAAENNVENSLPLEINMTTPVLPLSSNIEVGTNDCDKPRLHESSTTTSLQQLSSNIGAETSNFEHQLLLESNSKIPFVLDTPRKLQLKHYLKKNKYVIERQRKNLKRLNQKVRRLENRNESLKNIVKNLKKD